MKTSIDSRESHYGTESTATMRMLGGYFRFDHANAPLLVKLLPPVIHIRRDEPGATRVRRIVELIGENTFSNGAWRLRKTCFKERPALAEVAERVGYQSASAFSTAFTRLTGRSPSEFARSTEVH